MLMFLTRLGFDSKCVITGDRTQVDLPSGKQSGLLEAESTLGDVEDIAFVNLQDADVVRHELVQKVIQAYRVSRAGPAPAAPRTEQAPPEGPKKDRPSPNHREPRHPQTP
jgi:phosphate starvation-inducible PhoH-like protein